MSLSEKEKEEILTSYKWIKVNKFSDDEKLSFEQRLEKLKKHHIEETNFLIQKIREIVKDL